MAEQVSAVATGRTAITARSGDGVPTDPAESPDDAGAASTRPSHLRTGRRGEDLAAVYLKDIGWQILERNWRPNSGLRGELDIIARWGLVVDAPLVGGVFCVWDWGWSGCASGCGGACGGW